MWDSRTNRVLPLYLTSMGDYLPLSGFCLASKSVDFDFIRQQDKSWVNQEENQRRMAPNFIYEQERGGGRDLWESDEEYFLQDIFGIDILSPTTRSDLDSLREDVLAS